MAYGDMARHSCVNPSAQQPKQQPGKKLPTVTIPKLQTVNSGALAAFFSVTVGPVTLHKWKLFTPPGKDPFCTPAQESWDENGQRKYTTLAEVPREWFPVILAAALDKLEQEGERA